MNEEFNQKWTGNFKAFAIVLRGLAADFDKVADNLDEMSGMEVVEALQGAKERTKAAMETLMRG